jgi:putative YhdH/YhfP family quinone oxidoreductase
MPAGSSPARIDGCTETRSDSELPAGDVTIRVDCSSLNYKDAMAAVGHPGIVKRFPHVPGIDAAGTVIESQSPAVQPGDRVFTTGHGVGVDRWGGWSEQLRVPAEWVLPLPESLTIDEVMSLGTAGFTAAQCIAALQHHGITPNDGEVLVTGATGGVASLAIRILARLGYRVVAATGKPHEAEWLISIGAARTIDRDSVTAAPERSLAKSEFAGAIDTVGGDVLAGVLKRVAYRGCVAACGVAGGGDLHTTVYPFILRGVTLAGIDSAWCPDSLRPALWRKLATDWKPRDLFSRVATVPLSNIATSAVAMLHGSTSGRIIVAVNE